MIDYDDAVGWVQLDGVVAPELALEIREACELLLDALATGTNSDLRVGDKPAGGTQRLADIVERVPQAAPIAAALSPTVDRILGPAHQLTEAAYRCPNPGFGGQKLHADDLPRLDTKLANQSATAIVALSEFTAKNGATRALPGSNLRPDLQRQSNQLEDHPDEIRFVGPVGTAFVFTGHLLHAGAKNESTAPRAALQLTFRLADSTGAQ